MFTQVFVFARRYCGASVPTLAISVTAIVIFAIASCPTLLAQTHSMRATARPGRVGIGPQVRPRFSVNRTGVIGTRQLGHQSLMVRRFPVRHHRHFDFFFANACFNDPFFDPFLCRRFFFGNSLFLSQPLLLPYPVYTDASSYAEPEGSVSTEEQRGADLSGSIDRLTDEVERLREEQESARYTQSTPSQNRQAVEANPPARVLVFHDGRRSEIQNYAMVGNTLWVLTQERARKIPVSELDMDATRKANAAQGIEFP